MNNKFVGSGIIFPIEINGEGRPDIHTNTTLLNNSIQTILNWPYSQRFFNEMFGSRINELLEEPNDEITKTLLSHFVVDALTQWEKRILINNSGVKIVSFNREVVNVEITYRINSTKVEETFIFPFYKEIIY